MWNVLVSALKRDSHLFCPFIQCASLLRTPVCALCVDRFLDVDGNRNVEYRHIFVFCQRGSLRTIHCTGWNVSVHA